MVECNTHKPAVSFSLMDFSFFFSFFGGGGVGAIFWRARSIMYGEMSNTVSRYMPVPRPWREREGSTAFTPPRLVFGGVNVLLELE